MARLEWHGDDVRDWAHEGALAHAQAVLDALWEGERGNERVRVQAAIQSRWQQEFGHTLAADRLDEWAEIIAAGGRIVVTQTGDVAR